MHTYTHVKNRTLQITIANTEITREHCKCKQSSILSTSVYYASGGWRIHLHVLKYILTHTYKRVQYTHTQTCTVHTHTNVYSTHTHKCVQYTHTQTCTVHKHTSTCTHTHRYTGLDYIHASTAPKQPSMDGWTRTHDNKY